MKDLHKLKEYTDNIRCTGKLPKGLTPYMVSVLDSIYDDLAHGRESGYIQAEITPVLNKCGISTRAKGIGRVAYIGE